ncbi:hypothetical protein [Streptomyces sp. NPDC051173]|uniref:hypothetical protein n=1 Tax=Streptomyces sp. NPDC051173 TaxID=3155164 RepID=UPI00344E49C0
MGKKTLVGIRLFVEVLDYAPDTLTWRERHALSVLAENANDATRECWPGIEDDPIIAHRMRLPGRSSRYEVVRALREKKALESVTTGRRGHRAVYRFPVMGPAKGPGTTDPLAEKGSGEPGHSVRELRTQSESKGPSFPDPNDEKGSGNDPVRVREPHGKGPGFPDPYSSYPSTPSRDKDSSSRPNTETPGDGAQQNDHHLDAFGAFWIVYPKKRAREEAKKAWIAAIERGADPQHIVDAATAYARERADEDAKYTKHPATWLNKGCYDDEPDPQPSRPQLRAVSGDGYQPWMNPTDQSGYFGDL